MGAGISKEQAALPLAYAVLHPDDHVSTTANPPPVLNRTTSNDTLDAADTEGNGPNVNRVLAFRGEHSDQTIPSTQTLQSMRRRAMTGDGRGSGRLATIRRGLTNSFSMNDMDLISTPENGHSAQAANNSYFAGAIPVLDHADSSDTAQTDLCTMQFPFDVYHLDPQAEENLRRNKLKAVKFGQLTSFTTIGLCQQGLVRLSPNIGLLSTTTTLHLCCNNLTEIPPEIGHMKNLTNLSIASNRLTSLPDTIGFLTKLVELKASDNLLDTIPASISKLQKLTTLYLDSNRITYLPSEIGQVKLLATLDLSKNPLQVVPAELNRLKFLRTLTLKRCPLKRDFAVDPTRSPPTLKELAARVIVRQQLPILEITQDEVKSYLASAHTCTFCGGPYFEEVTIRGRIVERGDHRVPLEYRLCAPHWSTDNERLALLFCPLPNSAPSPIPSQLSSRTVSPSLAPKRFSVSTSQSQKSAAGSADRPALVSSNSSPALNLLSDSGRDSTRAGSNSSSSSNSPFSTLRRRRPSVTRSTSFTLPLSSLTKNPSLPTLPTAVGSRGFKATLLKKTGLRTSRSMSFLG